MLFHIQTLGAGGLLFCYAAPLGLVPALLAVVSTAIAVYETPRGTTMDDCNPAFHLFACLIALAVIIEMSLFPELTLG